MSYVSISAKIKSILEALTDDDGEKLFSVVFDYPVDLTIGAVRGEEGNRPVDKGYWGRVYA